MCYSTSLRKEKQDNRIEGRIKATLGQPERYTPYFYANGFDRPNLWIIPQHKPDVILRAQWGFIPDNAMDKPQEFFKKFNTLNAKSETIFESRLYHESVSSRRCLILADGFFEPHLYQRKTFPFFCQLVDGDIFCFAGIFNYHQTTNHYTTTIITMQANEQFAHIHNQKRRMPLVLSEDLEMPWLDPQLSTSGCQEILREGFTNKSFDAYPVNPVLFKNKVNSNNPAALQRVAMNNPNNSDGQLRLF